MIVEISHLRLKQIIIVENMYILQLGEVCMNKINGNMEIEREQNLYLFFSREKRLFACNRSYVLG
jgi:hypothetical protein